MVLPSLSPGDIVSSPGHLGGGAGDKATGDIVPTATHSPPVTTALPGLSPGAIAGIAVGTIVGLVLIVGFLLLIFFCGILVSGTWTFSEEVCGYGT